jgi:hypothetical protein
LAKAKKENAAQLAIIKRQDLRLKNPLRQMKFRDSEVTTDTDNSSSQQGRKRKKTKDNNDYNSRQLLRFEGLRQCSLTTPSGVLLITKTKKGNLAVGGFVLGGSR